MISAPNVAPQCRRVGDAASERTDPNIHRPERMLVHLQTKDGISSVIRADHLHIVVDSDGLAAAHPAGEAKRIG